MKRKVIEKLILGILYRNKKHWVHKLTTSIGDETIKIETIYNAAWNIHMTLLAIKNVKSGDYDYTEKADGSLVYVLPNGKTRYIRKGNSYPTDESINNEVG